MLFLGDVLAGEEFLEVQAAVVRLETDHPLSPAEGEFQTVGGDPVPRSTALAWTVLIGDGSQSDPVEAGILKDLLEV